jgi:hypothetical protein
MSEMPNQPHTKTASLATTELGGKTIRFLHNDIDCRYCVDNVRADTDNRCGFAEKFESGGRRTVAMAKEVSAGPCRKPEKKRSPFRQRKGLLF